MKRILLVIITLMISIQGYAQKQGINYQAVILNPNTQEIPGVDAEGNLLANTIVGIQFTINDAFGNLEYQENHMTSTDMYGMINLLIGGGNYNYSNFSAIIWDGTPKKLQVAIDFKGGSNYVPLSTQDLTYMPSPVTHQTSQLIDSNTASIAIETNRAIASETTLYSNIAAEAATARAAEQANTTSISEEVKRATDAEGENMYAISEEVTRAAGAEDANTIAISKEVTRAAGAEGLNTTAISEEVTRATGAEEANATAISDVVIRATTAEKINATAISNEEVRARDAEQANTTSISEEVTRATTVEKTNATAISNEEVRARDAEEANTTLILEEVRRATGAEDANTTSISDEVIRATAADLEINTLADGKIYLGDGTNQAQEVTMTGDVSIDNAGVATIGTSKVVSSMIADGTIVVSDLANSAVETAKIKNANVTTAKIANANVTNAKLDKANIPLSGFGAANADVALGAKKLTGVADPTNAQDAATKVYVDTANSTNANLTGDVTSSGNVTTIGVLSITNAQLTGSIDLTAKVTGVLPVANGGTGSAIKNFVDLTTAQTVAGAKTFSSPITAGVVTYPNTHNSTAGQVLITDASGVASWGNAAASVREVADEFSATSNQTSFTLTQTPSANSKVKMYINGIRISNTAYSVSGATLTYTEANNGSYTLTASDRVQFDYFY